MTNIRPLTLFLAFLLLPAFTGADTFSPMGTRWPSGIKKTLVGNSTTLFAANGDILAAYAKDTFGTTAQTDPTAQITLHAPEGILTIDYMKIGEEQFIVAACGTGGLQVVAFDGASFSLSEDAVVTESSHPREDTTAPAALDIEGGVGFTTSGATLIATMDDNYGFRVFEFTTKPSLAEVARHELSEPLYTMLVDLDRWTETTGHDYILTMAQNRELGLHDIRKDEFGAWKIKSLGKIAIEIPNLPSTALLYMSALTLRVADDLAHVIENSLGHFFSFKIEGQAPYLSQTYPAPGADGITLGYPLDLVPQGDYACLTTLMEKDDHPPGVQVMALSDKTIVGSLEQAGAGTLHQESPDAPLFLMDLKNGLSKISLANPAAPERQGNTVATPFAVSELLTRENYLFFVDGLDSEKAGFRVMDISNATQPKCLVFETTPGRGCDLAVDGDFYRLFVADKTEGVACYSLNSAFVTADYDPETSPPPSPKAPLLVEALGPGLFDNTPPLRVAVSSKNIHGVNTDFLHVLTEGGKLFSFPLPVPQGDPIVHETDTTQKESFEGLPGAPKAMEPFTHDYLLVACGDQGLAVVDLFSNPQDPDALSPDLETAFTDGLSHTVSVSSDGSRYAFIADDAAGIVAFDLFSDANTPAVIKLAKKGHYTIEAGHFIDLFVTDNNNLYAVTDQSLDNTLILDVSDPAAMALLSRESTPGSAGAIVAATTGGLTPETPALRAAYVADGQGGLAVRQTTDDDNTPGPGWKDDSVSCFLNTL